MKQLLLTFIYCIIICYVPLVSSAKDKTDISQKMFRYESDSDGLYHYYSKIESSGCRTVIRLRKDSIYIKLRSGFDCNCSNEIGESSSDIANSLYEIISFFDLGKTVRTKEVLLINISCKIYNAPLLRYLNENNDWPDNFYKFFRGKSSDYWESYSLYVEYSRKEIVKSKIYDPFVAVMGKIGCDISLEKSYADPIFFGKHQLTKEALIKWGFFKEKEAKKEIYPSLKGGILFKINCSGDR